MSASMQMTHSRPAAVDMGSHRLSSRVRVDTLEFLRSSKLGVLRSSKEPVPPQDEPVPHDVPVHVRVDDADAGPGVEARRDRRRATASEDFRVGGREVDGALRREGAGVMSGSGSIDAMLRDSEDEVRVPLSFDG